MDTVSMFPYLELSQLYQENYSDREEMRSGKHRSAKIMIVDDELLNLRFLEELLQEGGFPDHCSTTDPLQVLFLFQNYQPDLVILDLNMPHMDGLTVLQQLRSRIPEDTYLPILIISADMSQVKRKKALALGANDFISKPFDLMEVLLRIKNQLHTRFLQMEVQEKNSQLERKVKERTKELEDAQLEILERLAMAAEYRDDNTGRHAQRVGSLSALIAQRMGLSPELVERIRRAAPLHDLGKIGLPDGVLLKDGKLEDQEFERMKEHIAIGAKILGGSRFPLLQMAEEIAYSHHLRWDGRGYPLNLKGEEIPLVGRIVALADVFDALTHKRPYKEAWPVDAALDEIRQQSGKQFDPRIVEIFIEIIHQLDRADLDI